jgi:hypothetical protein
MSARRDFLKNVAMAISISLLPKILCPVEVEVEQEPAIDWSWYSEMSRREAPREIIFYVGMESKRKWDAYFKELYENNNHH